MLSSQRPRRLSAAFGSAASPTYIRTVPLAAPGGTTGAASYEKGFPPETFQPTGSGGVPPAGQDVNGVLFDVTGEASWAQAGGLAQYNGTFATAIGGYPKYAVLASTTPGQIWQSTVESNLTDPDSGGSVGWVSLSTQPITASSLISNNGYRVHSDGFIECWGVVSAAPNASTTVPLPYPHTTWCIPVGSGGRAATNAQDNDPCVQAVNGSPPVSFSIWSACDTAQNFYWHTRGF